MQFTIESRELTSNTNDRLDPVSTTIDAESADDAISAFVQQSASELVSLQRPAECRESIATVKKDDVVFLVRVYAA